MHTRENFALTGLLRIDGCITTQITSGAGKRIEPNEVFFLGIRPVTDKAFIRKDGQNFP